MPKGVERKRDGHEGKKLVTIKRSLCVSSNHSSFVKVATDVITNRANRCSFRPPHREGELGVVGNWKRNPVDVKQTISNAFVTDDMQWCCLKGNIRG